MFVIIYLFDGNDPDQPALKFGFYGLMKDFYTLSVVIYHFCFCWVGVKLLVMCLMITIANISGWANEGACALKEAQS